MTRTSSRAAKKTKRKLVARPAVRRRASATRSRSVSVRGVKASEPPGFIEPMKAQAVTAIPHGDWRLEIKYDGYRALAVVSDGEVTLWSRNRKAWRDRFTDLKEAIARLDCRDAILDGEIVALDEQGRPSFQRLQNEGSSSAGETVLRYYLFDLLRLDGESLIDRPIEQRQGMLADLLRRPPPGLLLSPIFHDPPERLLAEVRKRGLEGIIAKAAGSPYEPGRRSGRWLKCRIAHDQEFVIGGYSPPQGSRPYFGALLVGYHENGRLMYAGKVGTGFDLKKLRALHARFQPYRQKECPFANLPTSRRSRFGQSMTASVMRTITWLRPELVAQIKFAEWTDEGALRQPVFLGMRDDKSAKDVVREATAAED